MTLIVGSHSESSHLNFQNDDSACAHPTKNLKTELSSSYKKTSMEPLTVIDIQSINNSKEESKKSIVINTANIVPTADHNKGVIGSNIACSRIENADYIETTNVAAAGYVAGDKNVPATDVAGDKNVDATDVAVPGEAGVSAVAVTDDVGATGACVASDVCVSRAASESVAVTCGDVAKAGEGVAARHGGLVNQLVELVLRHTSNRWQLSWHRPNIDVYFNVTDLHVLMGERTFLLQIMYNFST